MAGEEQQVVIRFVQQGRNCVARDLSSRTKNQNLFRHFFFLLFL
jgi:hypothetical protein